MAGPGEVMKSAFCARCAQRRAVVGWDKGGCGCALLVLAPFTVGLSLLLLLVLPFMPAGWRCTVCGSQRGISKVE